MKEIRARTCRHYMYVCEEETNCFETSHIVAPSLRSCIQNVACVFPHLGPFLCICLHGVSKVFPVCKACIFVSFFFYGIHTIFRRKLQSVSERFTAFRRCHRVERSLQPWAQCLALRFHSITKLSAFLRIYY